MHFTLVSYFRELGIPHGHLADLPMVCCQYELYTSSILPWSLPLLYLIHLFIVLVLKNVNLSHFSLFLPDPISFVTILAFNGMRFSWNNST